jgi:NTE family protein
MSWNAQECERKPAQAVRPINQARSCTAASAHRRADRPTFVLGGGGNLGAMQVGMIYALVESGIRPGMIVGTSVGAINGAFLASRADLIGIREIALFWSSLRRRDVLGIGVLPLARGIVRPRGYLFDSTPMRHILESFLAFDRLEDSPIPFAVVATALRTGEPVVLDSGNAVTALLASSAIPRVLPPIEIDGTLLVDGGAAADVPLRQAVALGGRNLYVMPTARSQLAKMLDQGLPSETDDGSVHIVTPPDVHIPLGDLSQSRRLLELGYEHARAWIEGSSPEGHSTPAPARRIRRRRRIPGKQIKARGALPEPSRAPASHH